MSEEEKKSPYPYTIPLPDGTMLTINEPKYQAEPWEAIGPIVQGFGRRVGHLDNDANRVGEANAHRIVLCVNFLAGMESEKLELFLKSGVRIHEMMQKLVDGGAAVSAAQFGRMFS